MKTKQEIARNWLFRYTGLPLDRFARHIILVNFNEYLHKFSERFNVPVVDKDRPMQCATTQDITIINFGMGSPNAATVMDLLSAISPEAVLFLGKCGGTRKCGLGDLILPIGAIRGEGTSNDYFPPEIPALPAFNLQKAASTAIYNAHTDYWTGTIYTTNRRVWEYDESFKNYLRKTRCLGVDMETATLFITGFANHIPTGALLLVSDQPMDPEGIKTESSDRKVSLHFTQKHFDIGIDTLYQLINNGITVKHLHF